MPCLVLLALLALPLGAQTVPDLTLRSATLRFTARATVGEFDGVSRTATGAVRGGPGLLDARGWVEFPVATLRTGLGARDDHLRETLEAERFPAVRFEVAEVALRGARGDSTWVTLRGPFTVHGVPRERTADAIVVRRGDTLTVRADFAVSFTDHGVSRGLSRAGGLLKVRDTVMVRADLRFTP
jgi:polyisoprenoid-binding protein YceI